MGVLIVKDQVIDTFLMSCRALGREIETAMLAIALEYAGDLKLNAMYVPTAKNSMVEHFYDHHGFELTSSDASGKYYSLAEGPKLKFEFETERIICGKP